MRIWTDLAQWVGPTVNCGDGDQHADEPGDRLIECRGVVIHIADGTYLGTIAWQHDPKSKVSSHLICAKDGRRAQMVDMAIRAWTQRAGNSRWISIEFEGRSGDVLTPQQIEFAAEVLARCHQEHGVPLQVATSPSGRGLGHHSMGAENGIDWGHSQCPGPRIIAQKPAIVARAKQIAAGLPAPPTVVEDIVDASAVLSIWTNFQAPDGYNMRDHLLQAEAAAKRTDVGVVGLAAKLEGLTAVIQALASGNSNLDTAAILAHIDQRAAEEVSRDRAQQALIAELEDELSQLRTAARDAAQAAVAGLTGPPSA